MQLETRCQRKVRVIMSDNGTEFLADSLQKFLKSKGIVHEKTAPGEPSRNGVAERTNRLLKSTYRTLLNVGNISQNFWDLAIIYSANIWNSLTRNFERQEPI